MCKIGGRRGVSQQHEEQPEHPRTVSDKTLDWWWTGTWGLDIKCQTTKVYVYMTDETAWQSLGVRTDVY